MFLGTNTHFIKFKNAKKRILLFSYNNFNAVQIKVQKKKQTTLQP